MSPKQDHSACFGNVSNHYEMEHPVYNYNGGTVFGKFYLNALCVLKQYIQKFIHSALKRMIRNHQKLIENIEATFQ